MMRSWHQQLTRQLALGIFSLGSLMLALPSQADLIVPGSTYSARVQGSLSGISDFFPVTFDGLWESFTRTTVDGTEMTVRINESQTYLGGGRYLLEISLFTDGDFFPVSPEGGFLGIGRFDALDVLGTVAVESAFLGFYVGDSTLADADFYSLFSAYFTDPWDGGFLNTTTGAGWGPVGASGVNGIRLRITTHTVSSPESLALLGLGGLALLAQRRRKA